MADDWGFWVGVMAVLSCLLAVVMVVLGRLVGRSWAAAGASLVVGYGATVLMAGASGTAGDAALYVSFPFGLVCGAAAALLVRGAASCATSYRSGQ